MQMIKTNKYIQRRNGMSILVFGHKNPDTDSVASAIAFSDLKSRLGCDTLPCVLGPVNRESQYMLDYFKIPEPTLLRNVHTQVQDLQYDKPEGISQWRSILWCYKVMERNNFKTLAVTDETGRLKGIITMKDITMELIRGDFYHLDTSIENIRKDLGGSLLSGEESHVEGRISVISYDFETAKQKLREDFIMIVGDRYDVIEYALHSGIRLIMITGGLKLPEKHRALADKKNIPVISVSTDTYTTAKLVNQCNYVSTIMKKDRIVKFTEIDYLNDVQEEIIHSSYRNYPVVDQENKFLGFLNRRHVMNPGRKKVILVDHNEYVQSVTGLREAEIIEILDHHKIGDISTTLPISFTNMPVGSCCTIIHQLYKENRVPICRETAGLLMSGIISDTLYFRSPTTTELDRQTAEELNMQLQLDTESYAASMFKAGTSLEGHTTEEVFYRDFKEFDTDRYKLGIGQVFTLDMESVSNRRKQFVRFISKVHTQKNYFLTLLVITDILHEGSYLFYKCRHNALIPTAFHVEAEQGVFVPGVVSRKKQVIPKILEAMNMLGR
jgi:manganese-dependent inorganic pyrophosphatase